MQQERLKAAEAKHIEKTNEDNMAVPFNQEDEHTLVNLDNIEMLD